MKPARLATRWHEARRYLRHPWALLGVLSMIGLGIVSLIHLGSAQRIAAQQREDFYRTLATLLPPQLYDNDPLAHAERIGTESAHPGDAFRVYRASRAGQPVADLLLGVAPDGYAGDIGLLIVVRPDGVLIGVRVLEHRETPGLGDRIETARSDWITRFTGRSLSSPPESQWAVKRDGGAFDQFTGATITPRAVVRAVQRALRFYAVASPRLFTPAATDLPAMKSNLP